MCAQRLYDQPAAIAAAAKQLAFALGASKDGQRALTPISAG